MVEIEVTSPIIDILNRYGFATVAAIAMGWFIFFIYNYVTQNIIEKLDKAQITTIALIDRIRNPYHEWNEYILMYYVE